MSSEEEGGGRDLEVEEDHCQRFSAKEICVKNVNPTQLNLHGVRRVFLILR